MRESARSRTELLVRTALLADALRRVAGYGCFTTNAPSRLARIGVLREMAQVDGSLSPHTAGILIRTHLAEEINALPDGDYRFRGTTYSAEIMREGFRIELVVGRNPKYPDFEGDHKARQCRLMLLLERWDSYESWRKGPEREFLAVLAEHMMRWERDEAA